ncbi:MAG: hypothetical protein ACE5OZ_19765 [Candidatus Heimdallarchaeota archaeon]
MNDTLELFQVAEDNSGEVAVCNDPSKALDTSRVYVLINSAQAKIFIWIGSQATVRSKFVGAQAAQRIRSERNLNYRVISVGPGGESAAFDTNTSSLTSNEQVEVQVQDRPESKLAKSGKPPKTSSRKPQSPSEPAMRQLNLSDFLGQATAQETVQLFQVANDNSGELKPCSDPSMLLKEDKVFLLVNDELSRIFVWLGSEASVRARFVGAQAAQTIKRTRGIEYRTTTVELGSVPLAFSDSILRIVTTKQSSPLLALQDYNPELATRLSNDSFPVANSNSESVLQTMSKPDR